MPFRSLLRVDLGAVFGLAVAARLIMIADSPGGLGGVFGYDAGVYYAAADAFGHGRLPYRDFVLLHPPGVMLFLAPFAMLGRVTSDHVGFQIAVLFCTALAGLSATLVSIIGRWFGLPRHACLAGGAFFAIWYGTLTVDYAPRLEGLTSFLFLLAAYLLVRGGRGSAWAAGVAMGAAVTVKIWWVLPGVLVIGWLWRTDRARAVRFAAGAALTATLVAGPFFVTAPSAMWRMVVLSQAIRANGVTVADHLDRVNVLSSATFAFPGLTGRAAVVVAVLTLVLLGAVFAAGWRAEPTRIFVVVAAAQIGLLVLAPSYLSYYSGFAAGPLALAVAAAVASTRRGAFRHAGRVVGSLTVALAIGLTGTGLVRFGNTGITAFGDQSVGRRIAATQRCVLADSPAALIELDALSRGLANGCPNWVDVSGVSHVQDIDVGHETNRANSARWQATIRGYLLSGDAFIAIRRLTGLSAVTRRVLGRRPLLVRLGGFVLRRTH